MSEELCDNKRRSFARPKTCNGYEMKDPSKVTTEEIDEWYAFQNLKGNWGNDLLCAWGGHKIAMIDYDYFPPEHNLKEFEQFLIRFWMVAKCGIRVLYQSDGDNSIYYQKQYWKEALLLYFFHEKLFTLPDIPKKLDIFQGILLGYSMNSSYEMIANVKERIDDFLVEYYGKSGQDVWDKTYHLLKLLIYKSIYEDIYHSPEYAEFKKQYGEMQRFIAEKISAFEHSNELKAFAHGGNIPHPFSFGRTRSTARKSEVKSTKNKSGKKSGKKK